MKFVLLYLLLLTSSAFGQRTLTPHAFQVNVRPVLSGILNDFYQMITLFPDFPKDVVNIVEYMDSFTTDKEFLRSTCPRQIEEKCAETLMSLRQKMTVLHEKTNVLLARQRISSNLYMSSLSGMRLIQEFHSKLIELKGTLDNTSFLLKAKINPEEATYPLIRDLDELNTLISLTLVEFIPYNYRHDFRHFYFGFVHPIQQHLSKRQNYQFLNRNVNSLNFSLNLLNMNLTKRNKKTPEGMSPYLATIHNRWNSLLRYYF